MNKYMKEIEQRKYFLYTVSTLMKNALIILPDVHPSHPGIVPRFEFHIRKSSRIKYSVEKALFQSTGNIVFPNFRAVRELAFSINRSRGTPQDPKKQIRAGELNALGLLDEINHFLVRLYDETENPGSIRRAVQFLEKDLTAKSLESVLKTFLRDFPPTAVFSGGMKEEEYYSGSTAGRPNVESLLEELIMLYLSNSNPACVPFKELIDDQSLRTASPYDALFASLEKYFENEKPFGPDALPLIKALKSPMMQFPDNLAAQLGFLKEKWGIILSSKFKERIAESGIFSEEEEKYLWHLMHPFGGTPSVETFVPEYKKKNLTDEERAALLQKGLVRPEDLHYEEPQRFTPDIDWMPNVVIIAKNIYVWLDQLSKKYRRQIGRLDQIPDEELDQLAAWNFSGLWLIGVWERSNASKRIKQIHGNLDAVSSAYSLYDYEIAWDLGGEEAFRNLNRRAWQRGIRLAGDMVPNHMGLYSKWVIEHPEFFIQTDRSPYPNYTFTGENLSEHPDIDIRIEDGYWRRSDAAVVFQRIDKRNGEVRYLYHGNDGTNMPWNDTAQLNLLRADVREAIIQNILHVARKFSIIRFDAAMTLAKKHYQRLWFPMQGTSGVPSRQDHSMTRSDFDRLFPLEFWREVVDRFNAEMPHTLLLAEAFWLMEGYFVRTLGMHRVYNSAFMHMLMKEENNKFRSLIKNTLEFNPEILKRYVNFMSNPDEATAVEQFGKDDKYFGVAILMVTLPGLPMFAHGQIEGFSEKYGMEYRRAYYDEQPDHWLVRRHEEEIFPLMKKRYLFSQVEHFELFDFIDERGFVNENVFAYANRSGNERALIFFHNTFAECRGSIKYSLSKSIVEGGQTRSVGIADALSIQHHEKFFYRFRERHAKLEYLVSGKQIHERGWWMELKAFQYAVFTDFAEIFDTTGDYERVSKQTMGKGVASVDLLLWKIRLEPLHVSLRSALIQAPPDSPEQLQPKHEQLIRSLKKVLGEPAVESTALTDIKEYLPVITQLLANGKDPRITDRKCFLQAVSLFHFLKSSRTLLKVSAQRDAAPNVIVELHLHSTLHDLCAQWNARNKKSSVSIDLFKIVLRHADTIVTQPVTDPAIVDLLMNDFETADFLGVNQHNDVWYYNKEQFDLLFYWIKTFQFIYTHRGTLTENPISAETAHYLRSIEIMQKYSGTTGYNVEKLREFGVSTAGGKSVPAGRKKKETAAKTESGTKRPVKKSIEKTVKSVTPRKGKH
jgi:glycosidase